MEAVALLAEARTVGLQLPMNGEQLLVRGPKRLADLAQQLLSRKEEILEALDLWEERAAIAEYCGGLSRTEAERLVWACIRGALQPYP